MCCAVSYQKVEGQAEEVGKKEEQGVARWISFDTIDRICVILNKTSCQGFLSILIPIHKKFKWRRERERELGRKVLETRSSLLDSFRITMFPNSFLC